MMMSHMSRGAASPRPKAGAKRGAGSGSSSQGGTAATTRRYRKSTSDVFSPAWQSMGDICPDDKVNSLQYLNPMVGELQYRGEWELDSVIWLATQRSPFDPLLDRIKQVHNEKLKIEYAKCGSKLHHHTFDDCLTEVLVQVGLLSELVAATLCDVDVDGVVKQKLTFGDFQITLKPCATGDKKWHLGVDPMGTAQARICKQFHRV